MSSSIFPARDFLRASLPRSSAATFGAELFDDIRRSEMGHEKRRNKHRADHGLRTIESHVAGRAGDWQKECEDALQWDLQKLYDRNSG